MQVEMDPDDTLVALRCACDWWEHSAQRLEQLADAGFPGGSRLGTDNEAAAVGEIPRGIAVRPGTNVERSPDAALSASAGIRYGAG